MVKSDVTFKVPQKDGTTRVARGVPIGLRIGGRTVKFVLQRDDDDEVRWLTHRASGMRFGLLDDAKTELHSRRVARRGLAYRLIKKAVAKFGEDKVLAAIDAAPVIN